MKDKPRLIHPRVGVRGMGELQYAACCGDAEGIDYWLQHGSDVTATDDQGWTALHWAVRMACAGGDRMETCRLLLDAGAEINACDNEGSPQWSGVCPIPPPGAEINACDNEGSTVLDNAIEATASEDLIAWLEARGARTRRGN